MGGPRLDAHAARLCSGARDLARAHQHETVDPIHLLAMLVASAEAAELFATFGLDDLRLRVDARVRALPVSALYRDGSVEPTSSSALQVVLTRAGALRGWLTVRAVAKEDLVLALFEDRAVAALLDTVERRHGVEDVPPGDGVFDIVFHDDDVTTMELVVRVMCEAFDLSNADATHRMLVVHRSGSAVVRRLPAAEARERLAHARAMCLASRSLLRITAERVDPIEAREPDA
ncbi:MAG: ATP-dependent Clp protease adaptor ClpS [Labilithrix sp.]|nr:ATP-dependent Clp protease adaptor ClpS [Labilithrix sp.]